MIGFESWAVTSLLHDGTDRSILKRDLVYHAESGVKYTVPKGFKTDLASIPRVLWALYPPRGLYKSAAVLHDYHCETGFLNRKSGDELFLEAMSHSNVNKFDRAIIYLAVRVYAKIFKLR